MGVQQQELVDYLHQLLSPGLFKDYAPNGLQVEGKQSIKVLCTAVTASQAAIDEAISYKADALLVHHGYFWRGESPVLVGMKKHRIASLLKHDINLFAYHLPLDAHVTLGNNAGLGAALNIQSMASVTAGDNPGLLWHGRLAQPVSHKTLSSQLQKSLQREPLLISGHDRLISHVAWCTGGAQDYIEQAHALGVDAFISGEVSERTYYYAKELGISFFSAGHHATERFGVQLLGQHLSQKFSLQTHFLDSQNPV